MVLILEFIEILPELLLSELIQLRSLSSYLEPLELTISSGILSR